MLFMELLMTNSPSNSADTKLNAALARLQQGIENLLSSGQWQAFLRFQSRFHSYSFCNQLLIYSQCPHACRVAGYRSWQQLGRQVRKGEKGISILAPLRYRLDPDADSQDPDSPEWVLAGFKPVSVFDVSQTDGEPLPQIIHPLYGEDSGLFQALLDFAAQESIPVTRIPSEEIGANGVCRFNRGGAVESIAIASDLSPLHQAKTLVHELAHAFLHAQEEYSQHDVRSRCEVEAESIAFIVLQEFGLDCSDYSFGYVASWGEGDRAIAQVRQSGQVIQKTAHRILEAILPQPSVQAA